MAGRKLPVILIWKLKNGDVSEFFGRIKENKQSGFMGMKFNRWWIVIAAIFIQTCLGALYAWSIFVVPLEQYFGWTRTQISLVFTVASVTFVLVMIVAGKLQDKIGPRIVSTIGGILAGSGLILASFTTSLIWLYFSYGLLYGAGMGFCYICPLAAGLKWFPDKRGLIAGLTVAGFGAGALIFAPFGTYLMGPEMDWSRAFLVMGIVFLMVIIVMSQFLINPPLGWKPEGWRPALAGQERQARDFSPQEMLKTSNFWRLWTLFCLGTIAGLVVIGHLKPFGIEVGLNAYAAATIVGALGVGNGLGRPVWGFILDRIKIRKTLLLIYTIQGGIMFFLVWFGHSFIALFSAALIIGFNFGGKLAVFPALTTDYFGTKHLGMNYSLMLTAWGVGAIVGPILGGVIYDLTGAYLWAFIFAGLLCLLGGAMVILSKPSSNSSWIRR